MNYLITTKSGRLYYNTLKLFQYNEQSLYSGENSIRFIKLLEKDVYILGTSEELLIVKMSYKFEIIGRLRIPSLIDIKDIAIGSNFIAVLSGLRDSVYIFNKNLTEVYTCFNIGKNGNLEFFKERQSQCQEIPSNYFQIFYCPEMNNYYGFKKIAIHYPENYLNIYGTHNLFTINLNDFSIKEYLHEYDREKLSNYDFVNDKFNSIFNGELINDIIEC